MELFIKEENTRTGKVRVLKKLSYKQARQWIVRNTIPSKNDGTVRISKYTPFNGCIYYANKY